MEKTEGNNPFVINQENLTAVHEFPWKVSVLGLCFIPSRLSGQLALKCNKEDLRTEPCRIPSFLDANREMLHRESRI